MTTEEKKTTFDKDDILIVINNQRLLGNSVAPPLIEKKEYKIVQMFVCDCGQDHIDVGLKSNYQWISCYKCKNPLPQGETIHWCHPVRFEKKA